MKRNTYQPPLSTLIRIDMVQILAASSESISRGDLSGDGEPEPDSDGFVWAE